MKIVYLFPALSTVGGADRVIIEKANYFADIQGDEVHIITAYQKGEPIYFPLSKRVKHIDLNIDFDAQYGHSLPVRSWLYITMLHQYRKRLTQILCQLRADIVITTISRDIDFLHTVKDGSRKVVESHIAKPYLRNLNKLINRGGLHKIIGRVWTRKIEKGVERADALVVLTDRDAQAWSRFATPHVIPNSLPFYPEQSSNCEAKRIISVGRLDGQKGYDMLIEAWETIHRQHPDWTLTIYGNGGLHDYLERLIRQKQLEESFILADPVKNIIDKYLESSIYVMSSRFEGFGMVLAEAMACGVPCVSFNCPYGPSDIIQDGVDGLLATNGDTAELAKKINYLIENEDIRKQMGRKAKQNIKRYARELIMSQWVALFQSLKK